MKKFLNTVWEILQEIDRTRVAAAAARAGNVNHKQLRRGS